MIVPTYCERHNLPTLIAGVAEAAPDIDILVVDDRSPDGTGALCRELMQQHRQLSLLERDGPRGIGAALLAGFQAALARNYALVGAMDADLSHDPESLPAMLAASATHDLVLGSRYVAGGSTEGWSRHRKVLSWCANRFAGALLGVAVSDITTGYRLYRASLLTRALARPVVSNGYAFEVEMVYRMAAAGARIAEVPITFRERAEGKSKMSLLEIPRGAANLLRMRRHFRQSQRAG